MGPSPSRKGRGDAGANSSPLLRSLPPVEDLLAVPEEDAWRSGDAIEDALEIFDPERRAADVGVDGDRHDPRRLGALLVQALEIIHAAALELLARMMLHD